MKETRAYIVLLLAIVFLASCGRNTQAISNPESIMSSEYSEHLPTPMPNPISDNSQIISPAPLPTFPTEKATESVIRDIDESVLWIIELRGRFVNVDGERHYDGSFSHHRGENYMDNALTEITQSEYESIRNKYSSGSASFDWHPLSDWYE